ncbi:VanZ family protein [Streptomyces sp. B21-083]|uniref:VanZ family protein n=1 Tax=Streptomyces sp. B21-083 TaxID=3039410 RepID=UPI002FEF5B1D
MFTAIFGDRYGFLAALCVAALASGGLVWRFSVLRRAPHGMWWAALTATLVGVLGVTTFGGAGSPSGQCVINHQFAEPFHTTQGVWNLAMFLPVGFFALLALRKPLPALVGVTALPCVIELAQALVPGISRSCDSSDAEMNIIGGVLGVLTSGVFLVSRRSLDWQGWAKPTLFTALALGLAGIGVFRTAITPMNYDGTGLSDADSTQRQAAREAVRQAVGDRFRIGHVYVQPCVGVRCTNLMFGVSAQGYATLDWPSRRHLNIVLEEWEAPGPGSYPVPGATTPRGKDDAARIADRYMREHYPWAAPATSRRTYPVGDKATYGWMTSWRFLDKDAVLMPRMLGVQINRAGRVSRIDVTLSPPVSTAFPRPSSAPSRPSRRSSGKFRRGPPRTDATRRARILAPIPSRPWTGATAGIPSGSSAPRPAPTQIPPRRMAPTPTRWTPDGWTPSAEPSTTVSTPRCSRHPNQPTRKPRKLPETTRRSSRYVPPLPSGHGGHI